MSMTRPRTLKKARMSPSQMVMGKTPCCLWTLANQRRAQKQSKCQRVRFIRVKAKPRMRKRTQGKRIQRMKRLEKVGRGRRFCKLLESLARVQRMRRLEKVGRGWRFCKLLESLERVQRMRRLEKVGRGWRFCKLPESL